MNRYSNKVVVVTGGTSGIGLATAKAFAAEGAHVYITGRRQEALDNAVQAISGSVVGVRGDMGKLADIDHLYDVIQQQHGQIDVLVANAAAGILPHWVKSPNSITSRPLTLTLKAYCLPYRKPCRC
jgi:NAD(P)-dependent dehydrogenase (short-subunit alcohol dehydrogenase family)